MSKGYENQCQITQCKTHRKLLKESENQCLITQCKTQRQLLKESENQCLITQWNRLHNVRLEGFTVFFYRIPEVSRSRKLMKYVFRISFYGALCYGCYKFYRIVVPILTWNQEYGYFIKPSTDVKRVYPANGIKTWTARTLQRVFWCVIMKGSYHS